MRRIGIALVALVLGVPALAMADRPYESSIRPEINTSHEPIQRENHRVEKPSNMRPDAMGRELVNPGREAGEIRRIDNTETRAGRPDLRPDPKRDAFIPVNEDGSVRSVNPNLEVRKTGKPNLRPDPHRDAFVPTDETTGRPRAVDATRAVSKGKPDLRVGLSNKCLIAKCGD